MGANYRAACRARSRKEFVAKLGVVIEECDETLFWLELILALELADPAIVSALSHEANELLSILVASRLTALRGIQRK